MVIQHNLQAANANRMLGSVTTKQSKSAKKLSSGYRINTAADDAAGLTISEKMRYQVRGLTQASSNAQDGVSLIQIAEGALNEVHSILQRMNELVTQAANDTNATIDRNFIKNEIDELAIEIDRVAYSTQFNNMNLLDGSFRHKSLQVGATAGQGIEVEIKAMDTHGLGLAVPFDNIADVDKLLETTPSIDYIECDNETNTAYYPWAVIDPNNPTKKRPYSPTQCLPVNSFAMAGRSMKLIQNAVGLISQMRSRLGSVQNRLEHTIANLDNTAENTAAAESRIRDTDMAQEMVSYSSNNILAQAGQSMLAQANQNKQGILSLLQ